MNENIENYNRVISGLPISHTWRGHGSAIFIELGGLSKDEKRNHPVGEYSIMLDCDWRIEEPRKIQCGSFCSKEQIEKSIVSLVGDVALKIELIGVLPEILLSLESGRRILSFTSDAGQPEWGIRLPNGSWLSSKEGGLVREKA